MSAFCVYNALGAQKRAQNMPFEFSPYAPRRSSLTRPLGCVLVAFLALLALARPAQAQEGDNGFLQLETVVVDLRPGQASLRAPSQDAFIDGLGAQGEIHLAGDAELASILGNRSYSAALERGKTTLSAAILAFGSLDCASTRERAKSAILDFAAAAASGAPARDELRKAYLYLFLCADRQGDVDEAMAAATMLRVIIDEDRPGEIGSDTWDKYPQVDAQSNGRQVPVEIASEPSGASIWLDHKEVGKTPGTLLMAEGQHLVALGLPGRGVSQEITITGKGAMSLPLAEPKSRWDGIAKTLAEASDVPSLQRPRAMGNLMAATLSEVAFVMREPGRVAVWILPLNRRSAELVGHAPNAAIAAQLALQGLEDSNNGPGLDPNMPLLRENEATTTTASDTKRWWVYAVVLGAVAVGGGLIIAQDLSKDQQRIEVTLP
jgi:hypothetical protein